MKNSIIKITGALIVAAVALAWAGNRAYADPITPGSFISFGGTATFNNADIALATGFTKFSHETVLGFTQSGDYSGIPNFLTTGVSWSAFNFLPLSGTFGPDLWWVSYGGVDYHFTGLTVISASFNGSVDSPQWGITGTGTAYIDGLKDPSPGTFQIAAGRVLGGPVTFEASIDIVGVPDGGTTALLLGLGLVGMSLAVRRFKKA